ncbi:MAG: FAD-dependent oxidoreductase [Pseudomonadota bacterium]
MIQRRTFLQAAIGISLTGLIPLDVQSSQYRTRQHRALRGYLRTNWSLDPYSFGSYSFIARGARRNHPAILGRSVGNRLFFAGEATHPSYQSTVHAALESGFIAADAVTKTKAHTVAIIGAGASGLTAATRLSDSGYDVTVFEARDRIGGRIWTDMRLGIPLDLGASWIHGTDGTLADNSPADKNPTDKNPADRNPLISLGKELGITTIVTRDSFVMRGAGGLRMGYRDEPDWLEEVLEVQHSAGAALKDINIGAYWHESDYTGDDLLIPGGYSQIFNALPGGIDVRLGQEIRAVRLDAGSVQLQDHQGQNADFDAVIITVPLGVLKQGTITFTPPLSVDKQDAIARLGMGLLDKIYLKYDEVFWDKDVTWIVTPENNLPRGQFNQWLNLFPYIGEPVIMAFNGAQPARDLASLSDLELVARAEQTLHMAYPW